MVSQLPLEEPAAAISKQKSKDTKQRSDFKSHLVDTGCVLGDRPDSSPGFTFFSLSLSAPICEMGTCKHLLLRGHRVRDMASSEECSVATPLGLSSLLLLTTG